LPGPSPFMASQLSNRRTGLGLPRGTITCRSGSPPLRGIRHDPARTRSNVPDVYDRASTCIAPCCGGKRIHDAVDLSRRRRASPPPRAVPVLALRTGDSVRPPPRHPRPWRRVGAFETRRGRSRWPNVESDRLHGGQTRRGGFRHAQRFARGCSGWHDELARYGHRHRAGDRSRDFVLDQIPRSHAFLERLYRRTSDTSAARCCPELNGEDPTLSRVRRNGTALVGASAPGGI
jgi:hypothetical protein